MAARSLAPTQTVSRRPFTSVQLYDRDQAILGYMLEDLRATLARGEPGRYDAYPPMEWEVNGLHRRTIVSAPLRLNEPKDICVVGFFGERHLDRDITPLEQANAEIVLEFRNFHGILSYSSMELTDGNWANLVLHDLPDTRDQWRASEIHARAALQLAPVFYRTVRIHNGYLPGGIPGGRSIEIERTKYWDYGKSRVWHAVRELQEPHLGLAH
ncbi:MAG: hypothetical protein ACRDWA_06530 [Acidimicrobiia bacterium]